MKNVLVLEDNPYALKNMVEIVKSIGEDIGIYTATNLGVACDLSVKYDISLFIVDIILEPNDVADVSGIEFVKIIRAMSRYKFVPVIFISALMDPQMYAYKELHCYGYIDKPFEPKQAENMIKEALGFRHIVESEDIVVHKNNICYSIKKKDIVYIQSHMGKLIIKTYCDQLELYYYTCKKLMNMLKSDKFIECNRSTIVNTEYIDRIDFGISEIKLKDDFPTLKLGVTKKNVFREWIASH